MKKKLILIIFIVLIIGIVAIICFNNCNKTQDIKDSNPYLFDETSKIIEQDINKGMTVEDTFGNEWVWIVVPKTKVFKTAKNDTDYKLIEDDIKEYVKDYSLDDYEDVDVSNQVLASIYNYGGFWVSRYEIGVENLRNEEDIPLQEPVSKPNKYVYNYVSFEDAKNLSSQISNGQYNTALLYGFQWDLICKFIEENGYDINGEKITQDMIYANSSSWGNYYSSSFEINRGKYSDNYGKDYVEAGKNELKKAYKNYLLTTGASEKNKACNLYDFAGNVSEWTLEKSKTETNWNVIRDGSFYFNYGGNDPVNGRYNINPNSKGNRYGFRIGLTK